MTLAVLHISDQILIDMCEALIIRRQDFPQGFQDDLYDLDVALFVMSVVSAQMTQEEFDKLVDKDFNNCFSGKQISLNPVTNHDIIENYFFCKDVNKLQEIVWDTDGEIHYFRFCGRIVDYGKDTVLFQIIDTNDQGDINENYEQKQFPKYVCQLKKNPAAPEYISDRLPSSADYNLPLAFYMLDGKFLNLITEVYLAVGTWVDKNGNEYTYHKFAYINIVGYPCVNPENVMVATGYKMIDFDNYWNQLDKAFSSNTINPYNFVYTDPYELMLLLEVYPERVKAFSVSNWDSGKQLWYSDVVFKRQTNMSISVGSEDGTFFQTMNFAGRTSSLKNGDKVRIYYSVEKKSYSTDWTVYAIEKLQ